MKKRILSLVAACLLMLGMAFPAFANESTAVSADTNNDGKVSVTLTISNGVSDTGESIFHSKDTIYAELNIPYFDLALYGLEGFYYNPDCYENAESGGLFYGGVAGTKEQAEGIVTPLHAYIYATEILKCGLQETEAGQGALYKSGEMETYLTFSGSPGSIYVTNFWGKSSNLNYYVNYEYPEAIPGLGATADQVVLKDGDHISVHMIGDTTWNVYSTSFGYFESDEERNLIIAEKGEEVTLTLKYMTTDYNTGTKIGQATSNENVYGVKGIPTSEDPSDWNDITGCTDENGQITIDTQSLEAGIYYIGTDATAIFYEMFDLGCEPSAAAIRLLVEESEVQITYGDVNSDGVVNAKDATKILKYAAGKIDSTELVMETADVNGDSKVNAKDATQILKYAAGKITAFPVETQSE